MSALAERIIAARDDFKNRDMSFAEVGAEIGGRAFGYTLEDARRGDMEEISHQVNVYMKGEPLQVMSERMQQLLVERLRELPVGEWRETRCTAGPTSSSSPRAPTRSLARALAPKIRVVSVSPGFVEGEYTKSFDAGFLQNQRDNTPLGRFATLSLCVDAVKLPFATTLPNILHTVYCVACASLFWWISR